MLVASFGIYRARNGDVNDDTLDLSSSSGFRIHENPVKRNCNLHARNIETLLRLKSRIHLHA